MSNTGLWPVKPMYISFLAGPCLEHIGTLCWLNYKRIKPFWGWLKTYAEESSLDACLSAYLGNDSLQDPGIDFKF